MIRFSNYRHRILVMSSHNSDKNSLAEEYCKWYPIDISEDEINEDFKGFVTSGKAYIQDMTDEEYKELLLKYGKWAEVKPTTGREYEEAQKIRAELTYNVHMRYMPALLIKNDMIVVYNKKVLKIESVIDENERHKTINLVCSEVID